ncbi:hypothetical protein [Streptomyces sp. NPDC088350]|uniref:hypothetical protein n=1 Tax=Streptomyces sp. NPDC088350 TaxID=3365854 RepID=UPI0038148FF3
MGKPRLDLKAAAATGQQMFLASLIHWGGRSNKTVDTGQLMLAVDAATAVRPALLTAPRGRQLALFEPVWDFRHLSTCERQKGRAWNGTTPIDPQYADFLTHRARELAVSRGWGHDTHKRVKRGLMLLAALHQPFEKIKATTVHALAQHTEVSVIHLIDMLDDLELLLDDAPDTVAELVNTHLAPLPDQIRSEAAAYFDVLRNGTDRRRPRSRDTVDVHLRMIVPFALEYCAPRYSTLRQVTRNDLTDWLSTRKEHTQRELVALRDLFKVLKAQRLIFVDPARGIKPGTTHVNLPTPLPEDGIQQVATAARSSLPLRVVLALAGIHALFPREIRLLQDADIDLGARRLRRGDSSRPLDDFTAQAIREYRCYRDTRWPSSSNPHLLRTQQTARRDTPVSKFWLKGLFKNLPATADSLRQDRVLEEATAVGPDPLHIATMFNLSSETSMRYIRATAPEDAGSTATA